MPVFLMKYGIMVFYGFQNMALGAHNTSRAAQCRADRFNRCLCQCFVYSRESRVYVNIKSASNRIIFKSDY